MKKVVAKRAPFVTNTTIGSKNLRKIYDQKRFQTQELVNLQNFDGKTYASKHWHQHFEQEDLGFFFHFGFRADQVSQPMSCDKYDSCNGGKVD
mmetsp:Transcript_15151/g.42123  ORF Transcript_15151/g.42123 Transcript_15151/m.42123 type:complete len:93 (+) Transcript_15151:910-1188(+)